jgi:hydrophobe/amphiphile efflux-1 (HAE1) family protein
LFSQFFINRPIFAAVISLIIVVAGLITLMALPVAQYPEITPPTVRVSAIYPGANAQVVAETVAQPIEEQVNGVEGMLYMSSTCASNGQYSLTVSFEVGTDLDMAAILVQNRVTVAEAMLPEEVQRLGVTTKKQSSNIVLFVALMSPNQQYDDLFLSNYATLRVKDELARIDGVGEVEIFGVGDYSMRVWLDPEKLRARHLTTTDVVTAIREQNIQVAAGQIGQPPAPEGQNFQYTINTLGRLEDVGQFEDIIIKTSGDRITRIKDVARVELGSHVYDVSGQLTGQSTAIMAIFQLPGANSLEVGQQVKEKMAQLSKAFPEGLSYSIPYDVTMFVETSIMELVTTLFIAALLVFFTIFMFLQDWRATLIPAATIPVSLIGTFAVMAALGVSINMMSLFAIMLAIGIVVDDAIVVVENTVRNIDENGLSPKDATRRAMKEVTSPIIATTLVLLAVFVPTAFLGGITGQLYRQFGLTIAMATAFSSLNALTLSPALSALLLRPSPVRRNPFARAFNWAFGKTQRLYNHMLVSMVRRTGIMIVSFLFLSLISFWGFSVLPKGFLPTEDQGYAIIAVQLPDGASQERTLKVLKKIDEKLAAIEGIRDWISIPGYSVLENAVSSNSASAWIIFDSWDERTTPETSHEAILARLWQDLYGIQEANIFAFLPPAIMGLGEMGGFQMQLQDRAGVGLSALEQVAQEMARDANAQTGVENVYTMFRANVPQLFAEVDRAQAKTLGISLSSVFDTLQAYLGSVYVNDFNKFGRTYQVKVQADARFRAHVDDIRQLEVRNSRGEMIPLGTLLSVDETLGPQIITRYNMYPSASISGTAAAGFSSGQALKIMEDMAGSKLPPSMGFEWTGMSFQEKATGGQAMFIFALAVIFVYLVLCAQYESWTIPMAVILSVPLALLGTVAAVALRGTDVNVYTQIGVVLLIALVCKTAILIIEFAKSKREAGEEILDAAVEAARIRFRPILMTAFTFILGVSPLVIATGAGAAGRQALGTAVCGGMIAATGLLVLFVPVFYIVIQRISEKLRQNKRDDV